MSLLSRFLKREEDAAVPPPAPPPVPATASMTPPRSDEASAGAWLGATPVVEQPPPLADSSDATFVGSPAGPPPVPSAARATPPPTRGPAAFIERGHERAFALRTFLIELSWGEAQPRWIEALRPQLEALIELGVELELEELATELAAFAAVLPEPTTITREARAALLAAAAPLGARLPRLFALDEEIERRDVIIIDALVAPLVELDPLLPGKLATAGLARLENLLAASAEQIAQAARVEPSIAAALVQKVADWKQLPSAFGDLRAARRALEPQLRELDQQHKTFERSKNGWSPDEVAGKRRARRERDRLYAGLRAALARLGEVDFLTAIEKLPFGRRIEELARLLRDPSAAPPMPGRPHATTQGAGGTGDGRAHT